MTRLAALLATILILAGYAALVWWAFRVTDIVSSGHARAEAGR